MNGGVHGFVIGEDIIESCTGLPNNVEVTASLIGMQMGILQKQYPSQSSLNYHHGSDTLYFPVCCYMCRIDHTEEEARPELSMLKAKVHNKLNFLFLIIIFCNTFPQYWC